MTGISRRTVIGGMASLPAAGGTGAALAASGIPTVSTEEDPASKVQRLSRELSEALDEWGGGSFKAVVHPASNQACPVEFTRCSLPREVKLEQCLRLVAHHLENSGMLCTAVVVVKETQTLMHIMVGRETILHVTKEFG